MYKFKFKDNYGEELVGYQNIKSITVPLTLVLLNPDITCFANSVDPDQLASEEEAN